MCQRIGHAAEQCSARPISGLYRSISAALVGPLLDVHYRVTTAEEGRTGIQESRF